MNNMAAVGARPAAWPDPLMKAALDLFIRNFCQVVIDQRVDKNDPKYAIIRWFKNQVNPLRKRDEDPDVAPSRLFYDTFPLFFPSISIEIREVNGPVRQWSSSYIEVETTAAATHIFHQRTNPITYTIPYPWSIGLPQTVSMHKVANNGLRYDVVMRIWKKKVRRDNNEGNLCLVWSYQGDTSELHSKTDGRTHHGGVDCAQWIIELCLSWPGPDQGFICSVDWLSPSMHQALVAALRENLLCALHKLIPVTFFKALRQTFHHEVQKASMTSIMQRVLRKAVQHSSRLVLGEDKGQNGRRTNQNESRDQFEFMSEPCARSMVGLRIRALGIGLLQCLKRALQLAPLRALIEIEQREPSVSHGRQALAQAFSKVMRSSSRERANQRDLLLAIQCEPPEVLQNVLEETLAILGSPLLRPAVVIDAMLKGMTRLPRLPQPVAPDERLKRLRKLLRKRLDADTVDKGSRRLANHQSRLFKALEPILLRAPPVRSDEIPTEVQEKDILFRLDKLLVLAQDVTKLLATSNVVNDAARQRSRNENLAKNLEHELRNLSEIVAKCPNKATVLLSQALHEAMRVLLRLVRDNAPLNEVLEQVCQGVQDVVRQCPTRMKGSIRQLLSKALPEIRKDLQPPLQKAVEEMREKTLTEEQRRVLLGNLRLQLKLAVEVAAEYVQEVTGLPAGEDKTPAIRELVAVINVLSQEIVNYPRHAQALVQDLQIGISQLLYDVLGQVLLHRVLEKLRQLAQNAVQQSAPKALKGLEPALSQVLLAPLQQSISEALQELRVNLESYVQQMLQTKGHKTIPEQLIDDELLRLLREAATRKRWTHKKNAQQPPGPPKTTPAAPATKTTIHPETILTGAPPAIARTPATSAEAPATIAGTPAAPFGGPATMAKEPAVSVGGPATVAGESATSLKPLPTIAGGPAEAPATIAGTPAAPFGGPATMAKEPAVSVGGPATVVGESATSLKPLPTIAGGPAEAPATIAGTPAAPFGGPATMAKEPAVSVGGPATVAGESATSLKPIPTIAGGPATTAGTTEKLTGVTEPSTIATDESKDDTEVLAAASETSGPTEKVHSSSELVLSQVLEALLHRTIKPPFQSKAQQILQAKGVKSLERLLDDEFQKALRETTLQKREALEETVKKTLCEEMQRFLPEPLQEQVMADIVSKTVQKLVQHIFQRSVEFAEQQAPEAMRQMQSAFNRHLCELLPQRQQQRQQQQQARHDQAFQKNLWESASGLALRSLQRTLVEALLQAVISNQLAALQWGRSPPVARSPSELLETSSVWQHATAALQQTLHQSLVKPWPSLRRTIERCPLQSAKSPAEQRALEQAFIQVVLQELLDAPRPSTESRDVSDGTKDIREMALRKALQLTPTASRALQNAIENIQRELLIEMEENRPVQPEAPLTRLLQLVFNECAIRLPAFTSPETHPLRASQTLTHILFEAFAKAKQAIFEPV